MLPSNISVMSQDSPSKKRKHIEQERARRGRLNDAFARLDTVCSSIESVPLKRDRINLLHRASDIVEKQYSKLQQQLALIQKLSSSAQSDRGSPDNIINSRISSGSASVPQQQSNNDGMVGSHSQDASNSLPSASRFGQSIADVRTTAADTNDCQVAHQSQHNVSTIVDSFQLRMPQAFPGPTSCSQGGTFADIPAGTSSLPSLFHAMSDIQGATTGKAIHKRNLSQMHSPSPLSFHDLTRSAFSAPQHLDTSVPVLPIYPTATTSTPLTSLSNVHVHSSVHEAHNLSSAKGPFIVGHSLLDAPQLVASGNVSASSARPQTYHMMQQPAATQPAATTGCSAPFETVMNSADLPYLSHSCSSIVASIPFADPQQSAPHMGVTSGLAELGSNVHVNFPATSSSDSFMSMNFFASYSASPQSQLL